MQSTFSVKYTCMCCFISVTWEVCACVSLIFDVTHLPHSGTLRSVSWAKMHWTKIFFWLAFVCIKQQDQTGLKRSWQFLCSLWLLFSQSWLIPPLRFSHFPVYCCTLTCLLDVVVALIAAMFSTICPKYVVEELSWGQTFFHAAIC